MLRARAGPRSGIFRNHISGQNRLRRGESVDNDNIPKLDALLTAAGDAISVWTMSCRGAHWLNEHYRACCGSPGNCGCGSTSEKERWETGTRRETWLSEQHAFELLDRAASDGLNFEYLYAERPVRPR